MDNHEGYDDPQNFHYPAVTTDARGCYYIPVFRGVYSQPGWSWSFACQGSTAARLAARMDVMSPQNSEAGLQRFTLAAHVGILLTMIARPYLLVNRPFQAVNQKQYHPLRVAGSTLSVP